MESIFFQFPNVELRSNLHPDLRTVRVKLVDSTSLHQILLKLSFVLVAQFKVEDAPPMPFVFLEFSNVYICLC